jgi:hypothetical protein
MAPMQLRVGIIALTIATALIHFALAIPEGIVPFYLNALGYLGLVAALYWPRLRDHRSKIRWMLMAFTALTILLWLAFGRPYTAIGYLDKAIELALIALLWLEARQDRA